MTTATNTGDKATPRRSMTYRLEATRGLLNMRRDGSRVNLLDLPPRSDDGTDQIDALSPSGELSPNQFVFGDHGAGHSGPIPRTGSR